MDTPPEQDPSPLWVAKAGVCFAIAGFAAVVLGFVGNGCSAFFLSPAFFLLGLFCGVPTCNTSLGKKVLIANALGLVSIVVLYFILSWLFRGMC